MIYLTLTMSCWGIPSVIATISGISLSTASRIALAAKGGGTYITVASGCTPVTASATVLYTGKPK